VSIDNDYAKPIIVRNNVPVLVLKVLLGLRTSPFDELINFFTFFTGFIVAYGGVGAIEFEPTMWPGIILVSIGIVVAGYRPFVMKYITKR